MRTGVNISHWTQKKTNGRRKKKKKKDRKRRQKRKIKKRKKVTFWTGNERTHNLADPGGP